MRPEYRPTAEPTARDFAERTLARLEALRAKYPSEELREAIEDLKELLAGVSETDGQPASRPT